MSRPKVKIISLGCSKNLVDTERLLKMLANAGIEATADEDARGKFDTVVINTCGFIGDAKEESINEILQQAELKASGKVKEIIVMGCLSERYADTLPQELPEVDRWYGKFDWQGIVRDIAHNSPATTEYDRIITTGPHHAYLKIAEGCNRFCAFCAIPLITGRYKSRPIEEIVAEVERLVERGVHEFNIIAQDLSNYGTDLYGGKHAIAELIDRLASIEGVKWLRLHYAYPADFPFEMLDAMARHPNVCKYLDIALQHISDPVLKNMRRHISSEQTRELLKEIRRRVPGIHIRTTLMVGFPGEGEKEFEELKEFVKTERFERMGAFAYCEEDDTYAAKHFEDNIPEEVKEARLQEIMDIQQEIAYEHNQSKVGEELEIVIDREQPDFWVGRTEYDSPEVDPEVLVRKEDGLKLKCGEWIRVKIVEALPYELIAEVIK